MLNTCWIFEPILEFEGTKKVIIMLKYLPDVIINNVEFEEIFVRWCEYLSI